MATGTKRQKSEGIAKGLWIDQAVLVRHLQSRSSRSSNPDDKHTEINNYILKLADLVLVKTSRFDQE